MAIRFQRLGLSSLLLSHFGIFHFDPYCFIHAVSTHIERPHMPIRIQSPSKSVATPSGVKLEALVWQSPTRKLESLYPDHQSNVNDLSRPVGITRLHYITLAFLIRWHTVISVGICVLIKLSNQGGCKRYIIYSPACLILKETHECKAFVVMCK